MTPESTHRPAFEPYSPALQHVSNEALRPSSRRSAQTGANVIARQYKELHGLLRRRLLITVTVCVGFFGVLPIGSLAFALQNWGTVARTPAYMSPEQAAGSTHSHARTDIYSLGAVAYFLLTGRPPFSNRSATQIMAAHMYEAPAPIIAYRPEVGVVLDDIVRRCLAKNPADRFPDARALQVALEQSAVAPWVQQDAQEWWRQYESMHPVGHA